MRLAIRWAYCPPKSRTTMLTIYTCPFRLPHEMGATFVCSAINIQPSANVIGYTLNLDGGHVAYPWGIRLLLRLLDCPRGTPQSRPQLVRPQYAAA